jgi:hypothetical protein
LGSQFDRFLAENFMFNTFLSEALNTGMTASFLSKKHRGQQRFSGFQADSLPQALHFNQIPWPVIADLVGFRFPLAKAL